MEEKKSVRKFEFCLPKERICTEPRNNTKRILKVDTKNIKNKKQNIMEELKITEKIIIYIAKNSQNQT